MPELLVLSGDDVRHLLPMRDAIDAMRTAFAALSTGGARLPQRVSLESVGGVTLVMPGAVPQAPFGLGAKLVSVFPDNSKRDVPTVTGVVVLLDLETGIPVAVLDAEALTAIRTGAASGLATALLAREDPSELAMLGAGRQAASQMEAVCCVREIRRIRVWSRNRARAASLVETLRGQSWFNGDVAAVGDPRAAMAGADIVCTATSTTDPLVGRDTVGPGVHLNAIGSFTPGMKEVDPRLVGEARVVVDHRVAALAEAGEIIAAVDAGYLDPGALVELGDVVRGAAVGRRSADEVTLFKSVGVAVQDLVAGSVAVEQARAESRGTRVVL